MQRGADVDMTGTAMERTGEFTGAEIRSTWKRKRRSDEPAAWVSAQQSCVRWIKVLNKRAADGCVRPVRVYVTLGRPRSMYVGGPTVRIHPFGA